MKIFIEHMMITKGKAKMKMYNRNLLIIIRIENI